MYVKFFRVRKIFCTQVFAGFADILKMCNLCISALQINGLVSI